MLEHMNISETNKREEERQQVLSQTEHEVGLNAVYSKQNNPAIFSLCEHVQTNQTCSWQNDNEVKNVAKFEDIRYRHEQQIKDKLQRKLSESMLTRYHRWVFESNMSEVFVTLRKWVIQEAEFQTIAVETVHGLKGKVDSQQSVQSGK